MRWFLITAYCLILFTTPVHADTAILSQRDIFTPVQMQQGLIVADEPLASQAALKVLQAGGNAVDAAVTLGFAMAVTFPRAGNIGGGGFMLIRDAATGEIVALDYRETAPNKAHRDMFLTNDAPNPALSRFSHLAAGVPGTVAGLALALERYGTLSLAEALAPAIQFAEQGFPVSLALSSALEQRALLLKQHEATRQAFYKDGGEPYAPGEILRQPDLAKTLTKIAEQGIKAFYEGEIADLIVAEMDKHGGYITNADLKNYRPVLRKPIHGTYRGYDIYSMPPPSSGGVHIVQMLNMLEHFDLAAMGANSAATLHVMAETMKRAYADRARFLGDADFVSVPVAGLTDKTYAKALIEQIDQTTATPSTAIQAGQPTDFESNETTHFSIVDQAGNMVANTYTINFSFGSGIMVPGAGFLLNNEMDDFSAKPGMPNAYGLIGGEANAIEPKKRMLSSMSPTLIMHQGQPFMVTGSPGGSRIITTTLQIILNVIDHGMNIQEAVNQPRIHHQWLPETLRVEEGLSLDTVHLLEEKGHQVEAQNTMGSASSIVFHNSMLHGAADPRRSGKAIGF